MKRQRLNAVLLSVFLLAHFAITHLPCMADSDQNAVLTYSAAEWIQSEGIPVDFGTHVAVRMQDWNGDEIPDILVGCGDGSLRLLLNKAASGKPAEFHRPQPITAGKRKSWGTGYTGILLADLNDDQLPDLVVAHSNRVVSIHENTGNPSVPEFREQSLDISVQPNCQGRIDVADWDGDGLNDLICGSFEGRLQWFRNQGTQRKPRFPAGQSFHEIDRAYNAHPRILDFNSDGRLDLLLGLNWGNVELYLGQPKGRQKRLGSRLQMVQADTGKPLSIRSLNGDDTTPDMADLNADGVQDLVSGGKNGRIFVLFGQGTSQRIKMLRELLDRSQKPLAISLQEDESFREACFASLDSLHRDLADGFLSTKARTRLSDELTDLMKSQKGMLQRRRFNLEREGYLFRFAAQFWILLEQSGTGSDEDRYRLADLAGFDRGYRRLLLDHGVILIDNNTMTDDHLYSIQTLLDSIPPRIWDVDVVTVADWLGPAFREHPLLFRTGVNIFALPLGRIENSFPPDAPRSGLTDVAMICLAHELAHNMLDTVGRRLRPDLFERKYANLSRAAGPDVIFRTPVSAGIDRPATRKRFRERNLWNGRDQDWANSWKEYFLADPKFRTVHVRGSIQFFLDSPQEAFATLANQYFTDSRLMLELCKDRFDRGYPTNLGQFLLILDYMSDQSNEARFYTLRPGGELRTETVRLDRDEKGRITGLKSAAISARFTHAPDGTGIKDFNLQLNPESATARNRPNVVVILADDLGYGDVQSYNPDRGRIRTPHIDRLTKSGMHFTDAHSSSAVCSPSRYTLLTGRYHWRTRLQSGIVPLWGPPLISKDRLTIGKLARQSGYQTACIGKWHLGWNWPIPTDKMKLFQTRSATPDQLTKDHQNAWRQVFEQPIGGGPITRGFDSYFGTDVPNWPPYCFIRNDRTVGTPDRFLPSQLLVKNQASLQGPAIEDWTLEPILPALAKAAVSYIETASARAAPYLLYMPLTSPHTPLSVSDRWKKRSGLGSYADFVMQTDSVVGEILDAIESSEQSNDTLVLFTSDNGCAHYIGTAELEKNGHFPSGNFRGYKSDVWEGGHRIPFIARWPAVIAPGTRSSQLVQHADLLATLADILDVQTEPNSGEDSFSILPIFEGRDQPIRSNAVNSSIRGVPAIRQGQWKMIPVAGSGGWTKGRSDHPVQLYDLENDPGESRNVAADHPDRVDELAELLESLIRNGRSNRGPKQPNDVKVRRYPLPETLQQKK